MELLEQVESYLARTNVPPSTFGRMVIGDPRFVEDLRSGRKPRRGTQQRVREYLSARFADHLLTDSGSS
jgi:2,4-dienoyl-CoA reductase-like NADH-dependent reductase (Old Yellow Enzyme family)